MKRPAVQAQVVKGITKAQLVKMAMQGYVGSTPELQERQYQRMTKLDLAVRIMQRKSRGA